MSVRRVGLIVPSSNVTVETELPAIMREVPGATLSFHSSRARMKEVTAEQLSAMNGEAQRCATELSDADVEVIVYGCLVALISQGPTFHEQAAREIGAAAAANGREVPVLTSAGALVSGLQAIGAERVAIVTPYMKSLTAKLVDFLSANDIEVVDSVSLEVADNVEVGRLDTSRLPEIADRLDVSRAQAVVLSACVQMPSLAAITTVERQLGLPALSAATATARELLTTLQIDGRAPVGGALLDGRWTMAV